MKGTNVIWQMDGLGIILAVSDVLKAIIAAGMISGPVK